MRTAQSFQPQLRDYSIADIQLDLKSRDQPDTDQDNDRPGMGLQKIFLLGGIRAGIGLG